MVPPSTKAVPTMFYTSQYQTLSENMEQIILMVCELWQKVRPER